MNPTLNSPKYADPKSLAFQMYKKQQDRKQRINPYVPQLEQRYFRRNEGSTYSATIPDVTHAGDFVIVFNALWSENTLNRVLIGGSQSSAYFFACLLYTTQAADATKWVTLGVALQRTSTQE